VAFTLANGIAYVEAALKTGLDVDAFAGRLSFFFNAHNDLFEEVAKFRAARRLWAKIMKNRFHAQKAKSMKLRFHTQTGGSTLTAQQPDNNIARVTIQTLAAVLGGTQSLHTNSKDEALALPTTESVRIALRTQQIVAHESGVCDTVDPLAGSYYIESLTDSIEEIANEYINKIDEVGGAVKAIEEGYIQKEIADSAYRYQRDIELGKKVVVGMNKFKIKEHPLEGLLHIDKKVEKTQRKRVANVRDKRNGKVVEEALGALEEKAMTNANLVYPIIDAVRAYATVGEIADVLRKVFGEYRANEII
jgi:methylmalonyl-CoA mutase N-terminal domain/subunit